jgi:hypothetical protein
MGVAITVIRRFIAQNGPGPECAADQSFGRQRHIFMMDGLRLVDHRSIRPIQWHDRSAAQLERGVFRRRCRVTIEEMDKWQKVRSSDSRTEASGLSPQETIRTFSFTLPTSTV